MSLIEPYPRSNIDDLDASWMEWYDRNHDEWMIHLSRRGMQYTPSSPPLDPFEALSRGKRALLTARLGLRLLAKYGPEHPKWGDSCPQSTLAFLYSVVGYESHYLGKHRTACRAFQIQIDLIEDLWCKPFGVDLYVDSLLALGKAKRAARVVSRLRDKARELDLPEAQVILNHILQGNLAIGSIKASVIRTLLKACVRNEAKHYGFESIQLRGFPDTQ